MMAEAITEKLRWDLTSSDKKGLNSMMVAGSPNLEVEVRLKLKHNKGLNSIIIAEAQT